MVLKILKLAFRNVFRNRRRTLITLSSIISGGCALILMGGYMDYSFWGLRETAIKSELGHIQIYKKGFHQNKMTDSGQYLLEDARFKTIEKELQRHSEIQQYSRRLSVHGLVSNGERNLFFLGKGIEPGKEKEISSSISIIKGRQLNDSDHYKVLVGMELAKSLGVKIHDQVTLLATTFTGAMNALDFEVVGIISNGMKAFDERIVLMPLKDCQELLGTTHVERVIVLLNDTDKTRIVARNIQEKLSAQALEYKTWEDLADSYFQVKEVYKNIFLFMTAIIMTVIILSIMNTMTMSVMERTSEIGTMRAMGTSRGEVMLLMISEGFGLGLLGGAGAIGIGVLLSEIVNRGGGIYMPPPPGHTVGYNILINIVPGVLILTFALSVAASVISSILPAVKAARLNIVDALRYV